jgi:hypothetical protein
MTNNFGAYHCAMRWRKTVAMLLAVLCIACSPSSKGNDGGRDTALNLVETDSRNSPTNERSFELLFKEDALRFAIFQSIFQQLGKRCSAVTKATFEGGLDETDEWRVDCADSGAWQVWFKPDGRIDFDQCDQRSCQ